MTVSYDILAIACLNLLCVSECMYVYLCIYVCMYDVCHDIQIPCTRYVAINRLLSYFNIQGCIKQLPGQHCTRALHDGDKKLLATVRLVS